MHSDWNLFESSDQPRALVERGEYDMVSLLEQGAKAAPRASIVWNCDCRVSALSLKRFITAVCNVGLFNISGRPPSVRRRDNENAAKNKQRHLKKNVKEKITPSIFIDIYKKHNIRCRYKGPWSGVSQSFMYNSTDWRVHSVTFFGYFFVFCVFFFSFFAFTRGDTREYTS